MLRTKDQEKVLYRLVIRRDNKPFMKRDFDDIDLTTSIAFWIERAVMEYNYAEEISPSGAGLKHAAASLLSDLNKSKILKASFNESSILTSLYNAADITSLFKIVINFAKSAGLDVVIKPVEPIPTLKSLAANTLIQHKYKYKDRINKLSCDIFNAFPNLHTEPHDFIKTKLYLFLISNTQTCIEDRFVFQICLLLQNPNAKLYQDINRLLTKFDYKNSFTADIRKNLIIPLIKLLNQLHRKEINSDDFDVSIRKLIDTYTPASKPSIFLSHVRRIYLNGVDLAKNLHGLLSDKQHQLPETFNKSLRSPLTQIIKDYNEFVIDRKKNDVVENSISSVKSLI